MGDEAYLDAYSIPTLIAELALSLMVSKPADHRQHTRNWLADRLVSSHGREEEEDMGSGMGIDDGHGPTAQHDTSEESHISAALGSSRSTTWATSNTATTAKSHEVPQRCTATPSSDDVLHSALVEAPTSVLENSPSATRTTDTPLPSLNATQTNLSSASTPVSSGSSDGQEWEAVTFSVSSSTNAQASKASTAVLVPQAVVRASLPELLSEHSDADRPRSCISTRPGSPAHDGVLRSATKNRGSSGDVSTATEATATAKEEGGLKNPAGEAGSTAPLRPDASLDAAPSSPAATAPPAAPSTLVSPIASMNGIDSADCDFVMFAPVITVDSTTREVVDYRDGHQNSSPPPAISQATAHSHHRATGANNFGRRGTSIGSAIQGNRSTSRRSSVINSARHIDPIPYSTPASPVTHTEVHRRGVASLEAIPALRMAGLSKHTTTGPSLSARLTSPRTSGVSSSFATTEANDSLPSHHNLRSKVENNSYEPADGRGGSPPPKAPSSPLDSSLTIAIKAESGRRIRRLIQQLPPSKFAAAIVFLEGLVSSEAGRAAAQNSDEGNGSEMEGDGSGDVDAALLLAANAKPSQISSLPSSFPSGDVASITTTTTAMGSPSPHIDKVPQWPPSATQSSARVGSAAAAVATSPSIPNSASVDAIVRDALSQSVLRSLPTTHDGFASSTTHQDGSDNRSRNASTLGGDAASAALNPAYRSAPSSTSHRTREEANMASNAAHRGQGSIGISFYKKPQNGDLMSAVSFAPPMAPMPPCSSDASAAAAAAGRTPNIHTPPQLPPLTAAAPAVGAATPSHGGVDGARSDLEAVSNIFAAMLTPFAPSTAAEGTEKPFTLAASPKVRLRPLKFAEDGEAVPPLKRELRTTVSSDATHSSDVSSLTKEDTNALAADVAIEAAAGVSSTVTDSPPCPLNESPPPQAPKRTSPSPPPMPLNITALQEAAPPIAFVPTSSSSNNNPNKTPLRYLPPAGLRNQQGSSRDKPTPQLMALSPLSPLESSSISVSRSTICGEVDHSTSLPQQQQQQQSNIVTVPPRRRSSKLSQRSPLTAGGSSPNQRHHPRSRRTSGSPREDGSPLTGSPRSRVLLRPQNLIDKDDGGATPLSTTIGNLDFGATLHAAVEIAAAAGTTMTTGISSHTATAALSLLRSAAEPSGTPLSGGMEDTDNCLTPAKSLPSVTASLSSPLATHVKARFSSAAGASQASPASVPGLLRSMEENGAMSTSPPLSAISNETTSHSTAVPDHGSSAVPQVTSSVAVAMNYFFSQEDQVSQEEVEGVREALAHYDALAALDETQLETLVRTMTRVEVNRGEVIMREGEATLDKLILVMAGKLSVMRKGLVMRTVSKGQFYGEMEMFYHVERSRVTLSPVTPTVVLYTLTKKDYQKLVIHEKDARRYMFLQYVNQCVLFKSLSPPMKMRLADAFRVCRVRKGVKLTEQGSSVQWMYLLMSGTVNMTHKPTSSSAITSSGNRGSQVYGREETTDMLSLIGGSTEALQTEEQKKSRRSVAEFSQTVMSGTGVQELLQLADAEHHAYPVLSSSSTTRPPHPPLVSSIADSDTKEDGDEASVEKEAPVLTSSGTEGTEREGLGTSRMQWRLPRSKSSACATTSLASTTGSVQLPSATQFRDSDNIEAAASSPPTLSSPITRSGAVVTVERSKGQLIGESEFAFKCKGLFTAVAATPVQAARLSRLHFEAIMTRPIIEELKRSMLVNPDYFFFESTVPEELKQEMRSLLFRQNMGSARRIRASQLRGSVPTNGSPSIKGSTAASSYGMRGQTVHDSIKSPDDLTHTLFTSESRAQLERRRASERSIWPASASSIDGSGVAALLEENCSAGGGSTLHRLKGSAFPSGTINQSNDDGTMAIASLSHRKSKTVRRGTVASTKRSSGTGGQLGHISANGDIIFSGSRNLYRFSADALCANQSIMIGVVVDGTIIRWNSVAQQVTGVAPFEAIGKSIFDFIASEDGRQRMRDALRVGSTFAGRWDEYVAAKMQEQHVFPFRQNTGLYQVGLALSVVPSNDKKAAEVLLLVGREAKYMAAATYAADVARWLDEFMKPQLRQFQRRMQLIESHNWVVTHDDALHVHGHLDACISMVEQFTKLSVLNMESVNESWRPLRLANLLRRFAVEATSTARQHGHEYYCNIDAVEPRSEIFLDAPQLLTILQLLLDDVMRCPSVNASGESVAVHAELCVTVVEPHDAVDGGRGVSTGRSGITSNRQSTDNFYLTSHSNGSTADAMHRSGGLLLSDGGPSAVGVRVSESGAVESSMPSWNGTNGEALHTNPLTATVLGSSSLKRIRFELRDDGPTIPCLRSPEAVQRDAMATKDAEASSTTATAVAPLAMTSTGSSPGSAPPQSAMHPPVTDATMPERGMELQKVEKIISNLGGIVYGFTRPEACGNVVRVELPLLVVPGSEEEGKEDDLNASPSGVTPTSASGRTFTVIVADNNRLHQQQLCHVLWARQHAVIPVTSFRDVVRKLEMKTADILLIDPLQIDVASDDYDTLLGDDPFDDIRMLSSHVVLVVMSSDFSDWRVQRLLDRHAVIELPKVGSGTLIHIAMQEAEQLVMEMRDEEERIELIRRTFTNSSTERHKIGRRIGKGTFGDVYEVEDTLTGGKMAMKQMRLHDGLLADEVVQEILAMTSLQHENIIHYFYCEKESDMVLRLYMELAPGGTLQNKIRQNPGVGLPFEEIVHHLSDICHGLAYVHAQSYVHGDLKTANLLLGTRGRTKIGDFGTAKHLTSHQLLYTMVGTPQYMAPEVLTADAALGLGYDFSADIWSLGCIVLEMATGLSPFAHLECTHGMGIIKYLTELTDTPDLSPLFSGNPLIYEFAKSCLDIDPHNRPSAQDLLRFDILQGAVASQRAERLVKRAEMLYKLNKYAAMRAEGGGHGDGDSGYSSEDSNATEDYYYYDYSDEDGDFLIEEGEEEEEEDEEEEEEEEYGTGENTEFSGNDEERELTMMTMTSAPKSP